MNRTMNLTMNLTMAQSTPSALQKARGNTAFFEPLEDRTLMSTYYISTSGKDSNSGTSINSPWRSTGKVSSTHLNPGDKVLFQGGQTFSGGLTFYGDGGSASNPVIIGSYGSGNATIASGASDGAWSLNTTGITFENLNFVGKPGNESTQDGIRIENYTSNSVRSGFTVTGCNISGYAGGGIMFGGDTSTEGLNDVTISNNNVYNNEMVGIESYAEAENLTNVMISNNLVHNNYGDGKSVNSGDGIMLQGLNGATIEYNSAYDNGITGGMGEVGIWCYLSNEVMVQYNQSYDNRTVTWDDGDGFDFDSDTSNSVMQYNLAYDNDGGGFQLDQWHNDNLETGDIIRFNISQDNGRKNNYSGIDVWGKVLNAEIYNNTVYNEPAQNGQTSDIRISNNTITNLFASNVYIANNVFVSTGGTPLVDFYAAAMSGAKNIVFAGNVYYSYSGNSNFIWGGTEFTSLTGWRNSTGQEKMNGQPVGLYANPDLDAPGDAVPFSSAADLASQSVADYDLQHDTPILDAGVALNTLFNLASPLTGGSTSKTIPGVDQSLAASASAASTTASSSGTSAGTVGSSTLTGWDIGDPNAGSNSESGGSDIVTAGGKGITGTSDSYRYVFTTLSGNGQIIAKVASSSDTSSAAKAGVMIRSANTANAAEVSLLLGSGSSATMVDRSSTGASTSTVKSTNDSGDDWVKLVRNGNAFSSYISANGTTWTLVSTTDVTMGTSVYIGLAVSSGAMNSLDKVSYSNVSVT
jgi:hypothetical protein